MKCPACEPETCGCGHPRRFHMVGFGCQGWGCKCSHFHSHPKGNALFPFRPRAAG